MKRQSEKEVYKMDGNVVDSSGNNAGNLKRINKYISETGYCSRREADKLVESGVVTINGELAAIGTKVSPSDVVTVKGEVVGGKKKPVYIAFHKPVNVTSTTDLKDPTNIIDYIGYPDRIFPIGRLDKSSEGLIFLTNDGDIVNKILRSGNNHEKEYIVTVNHPVTEEFLTDMAAGVDIGVEPGDIVTQPCTVKQVNRDVFNIVLTQGINRQIRRMCDALNYQVYRLIRVRIMNVQLKGIESGKWRYLDKDEIAEI
ncbi:MAG: pseudouridine synthase, partial [Vallitaleaceae bacterium]|nr:pseudouridine synthase [Vallitaleaceae bacterium]